MIVVLIIVIIYSQIGGILCKKELDILLIQIGGILCPYVNMLSDVWVPAPNLIYGGLAVLGNLIIILLFILKIRLMLKSMWPKSDEYKQRFGS